MDDGGAKRTNSTARAGLAAVLAFVVLETMPVAWAAPSDSAAPSDAKAYCTNIAAEATNARFAWQTSKLKELEARIKSRIQDLDAKQAELRAWIDKREAADKMAGEKLVGIYAKMRPETAATQISTLDDDMAAAVLRQLNPRQASAIFNEIVPERAAKLAGMIAGIKPAEDKKL